MMIVREATVSDIRHVCRNLRELNAREAFALRYHNSPEALAAELIDREPLAIRHYCALTLEGEPVSLFGAWVVGPRRATMAMRSTDQWLTVARTVYRFLVRVFVPFVLAPNVNVAETEVLQDGPSREWLRRLGCVECSPALPRGKNGEMVLTVAWVNPEPVYG